MRLAYALDRGDPKLLKVGGHRADERVREPITRAGGPSTGVAKSSATIVTDGTRFLHQIERTRFSAHTGAQKPPDWPSEFRSKRIGANPRPGSRQPRCR